MLKCKDEKSFNYLYNHYSSALYGVIFRIVKSKVWTEEIIQNVYMTIWNLIPKYDSSKNRFYSWLISIARNEAIYYLQSKCIQKTLENLVLDHFLSGPSHFSDSGNPSDGIHLNNVLKNLDPGKQILIELAYYQSYPLNEICDKLQITITTFNDQMYKILIELKYLLRNEK